MQRYYSTSGNQLYESCDTARAAGRPAKIQLEAHRDHDTSKFINFDIFWDIDFCSVDLLESDRFGMLGIFEQ